MPTSTIGPTSVYDGQTTSHTIQSDIIINDQQIRWQGESYTETNTNFDNLAITENSTKTFLKDESTEKTLRVDGDFSLESDETFEGFNIWWEYDASALNSVDTNVSGNPDDGPYDCSFTQYDIKDNVIATGELAQHGDLWCHSKSNTRARMGNSDDSSQPAGKSYEQDLGDSYFDVHFHPYEGVVQENTIKATVAKTYSYETTGSTYDTKSPSVSNDVSASGPFQLDDGEWSSWYSLSGLTPGTTNDIYHSIDGSGDATFEIEYTWEYAFPSPVYGTVGFYDESDGVWKECAVTTETDESLEYDHIKVYSKDQSTWGTLDVVPVSDDDAISGWEFYDSDLGWFAPRAYTTTQG